MHYLVERVTLTGVGVVLRLAVDGEHVSTFVDTEQPYSAGSVGVYSEDAEVEVTHVAARRF